ncbi:DUF3224 domain-containing protein [Pseudonocardia lacus]|jgi:hypothetical protein|uniref:DUF3224 domain-containing protein n=1 Tax=Pseudonocardia lacus TaxID=2835865 RepID=UPI001BDC6881|nr:DUF3224 domain-containing protein [Pseudonocardia lacus]
MTTTTGRFDLTSWDEEVIDEADGTKRARARNTKSFQGGITGESATEMLQGFAGEGTATYVAIERVTAAVDGRKGGFLLRHSALMAGGGGDMLVDVVPNSGTDELVGLTGTMTIALVDGEHSYTFDYDLG